MKICAAQIQPKKGDIKNNINRHLKLIDLATDKNANAIFFPELSITGYEPVLAKELAIYFDAPVLNIFQKISDEKNITIGAGMPTKNNSRILISHIIFQPNKKREIYSKQYLHSDETPYFIGGNGQFYLTIKNKKIAPAICYESLLPAHAENVFKNDADIYMVCVAKSQTGINKAYKYFPKIAKQYGKPVLMANCIGFCDDFESIGMSGVWIEQGKLIGQLNKEEEGVLIYDTKTNFTRHEFI